MNDRTSWLRSFLGRAGAAATLAAAVWLALAASSAVAQDNSVRIDPADALVAPDGSVDVAVIADPPEQSLATWVIDVAFDPDVLSVFECASLISPPGAVSAFDCEPTDSNGDSKPDVVKVLGVVLFTSTQAGLTQETTLATITFDAAGSPGACTSLTLTLRLHADSNGEPTGAAGQGGDVCIGGAPEQRLFGDSDCDGAVNIGDAINVARAEVGLPVDQVEPCPALGAPVTIDDVVRLWMDTDCGGAVNLGDAINIARREIGLAPVQAGGCPPLGATVTVIG